jgi:cyclic pyranopterin phosphate synthase
VTDRLTHLDEAGRTRMVDVSEKSETLRVATARGEVRMRPETLARIRAGQVAKGDVLAAAQLAAVQGAKRTWELVPLCHPIPLSGVDVEFRLRDEPPAVEVRATVRAVARTGVEMEALCAVLTAALCVYDMCKAVDRDMTITDVWLEHKAGGRSGEYRRSAGGG